MSPASAGVFSVHHQRNPEGLFLKIYFDKLRLSETIMHLLLSESGNTLKILLSLKCIHEINDELFYLNKSAPQGRYMRFLKIQVMCLGQRKIEQMTLQGCFVCVCVYLCVCVSVCVVLHMCEFVYVCVCGVYMCGEKEKDLFFLILFLGFLLYSCTEYNNIKKHATS